MNKIPKSPILVTGSHRSGTTWVGKVLSTSPSVGYIHEPFNPIHRRNRPGVCKAQFKHWFSYVTEDNESAFSRDLSATMEFRYGLTAQLKQVIKNRRGFRTLLRDYSDFLLNCYVLNARPLIKDPIALFSTEWLSKKYNMDVVILIRHPAAFVSSIKRLDWRHDFSNFLEQPLLMEHHLHPFEAEIKDFTQNEHDIIDQAILLWRMFYHVVDKYRRKHQEFILLRHEDLSLRPVPEFSMLMNKLNIKMTKRIENKIEGYSLSSNPAEAPDGVMHQLKRNSAANINNWQNRLSKSEIKRIREKTQDVSSLFYSDEDWQ